jgi:hypothetical protein
VAFVFYAWKVDRAIRYKALIVFYLAGTVLLTGMAVSEVNTHFYNLLYPLTSLFLSHYFYTLFRTRLKKSIAVMAGVITLLYFSFHIDNPYFDSIGYVIASTGMVVLIFLYLHQVLNHVTEEPLSLNIDFWFVCVQLAYHLGSFAIFLSYNYFTEQYMAMAQGEPQRKETGTILTYLWVVHNVLLFLGALIISFGISWIYRRKSRSSS